jgi:hypothetical protein
VTCSPSEACSPGSAGLTSASSAPVCELCGSASRTLSASGSSRSTGPESRVIPTCAPLWPTPRSQDAKHAAPTAYELSRHPDKDLLHVRIARQGCPCRCHTSTSSAAASPARTSPSPAGEKGSTEHARVFGESTPDSFATYDPVTSSWRTSQLSLLEEWSVFSETWPRWGTTQNGAAYAPPMSELPTAETESGSWGTPTARDWKDTGDMTNVPENGLLGRQVLNRGSGGSSVRDGGENLRTAAGGALNPEFVEWLMGFPLGWTEVE